MTVRAAALLVLLAAAAGVQARMYQWTNPLTGNVELSGTPPSWYRSGDAGPRVLVFDSGRLVDDTSIARSRESAQALREAAFDEAERRRNEETVKRLERAARRAALRQEQAEREALAAAGPEQPVAAAEPGVPEEIPEKLDASVVERLKAVIQAWDRQASGNRFTPIEQRPRAPAPGVSR